MLPVFIHTLLNPIRGFTLVLFFDSYQELPRTKNYLVWVSIGLCSTLSFSLAHLGLSEKNAPAL